MSLNIGLLNAPILSSASLATWQANNAEIVSEDDSTCVVSFQEPVGDTFYDYTCTVDKTRWLQTILYITGYTYYHASYVYGEFQGLPVLRKVAMYRDTTMGRGGVEFYDIEINCESAPVLRRPAARMAAAGPRERSLLLVGNQTPRPLPRPGSSTLYVLTGRRAAFPSAGRQLGHQLLIETPRICVPDR